MESHKDICHISDIIKRVTWVALVEVLRVRERGARIEVRYLEMYKGTVPDEAIILVPTLWGKYASDWFKKGESAVIFATGREKAYSAGRVGRMPLSQVEGKVMVESFADDKSYLDGLKPVESDGRILVEWDRLRSFLMTGK